MPHNCQKHPGEAVQIGSYRVWAGGESLSRRCLRKVDVLITLTGTPAASYNSVAFPGIRVHNLALPDFGGVTEDWQERVTEILGFLEAGEHLAIHCLGGFGRTGTLLGSLVAILESREDTPDPIAAIRSRYCPGAVETRRQAAACFALRGEALPEDYPVRWL